MANPFMSSDFLLHHTATRYPRAEMEKPYYICSTCRPIIRLSDGMILMYSWSEVTSLPGWLSDVSARRLSYMLQHFDRSIVVTFGRE